MQLAPNNDTLPQSGIDRKHKNEQGGNRVLLSLVPKRFPRFGKGTSTTNYAERRRRFRLQGMHERQEFNRVAQGADQGGLDRGWFGIR